MPLLAFVLKFIHVVCIIYCSYVTRPRPCMKQYPSEATDTYPNGYAVFICRVFLFLYSPFVRQGRRMVVDGQGGVVTQWQRARLANATGDAYKKWIVKKKKKNVQTNTENDVYVTTPWIECMRILDGFIGCACVYACMCMNAGSARTKIIHTLPGDEASSQ